MEMLKGAKTTVTVAVAAMMAVLAGCQSPVTAGAHGKVSVSGDSIINATLAVDNPAFARHISLTDVRTRLLPNGLLQVQAVLQSTDRRDYSVQYKFRWFDETGMEITGTGHEPWMTAVVHGGETISAIGVSPQSGVAAVAVAVRQAP